MHAEEVKNKHFDAFLQNKSIKDKKSFFEPFCKARLVTENETNKKILNALSVVKEVFQAFGLLVKKPVKLTEGSKYGIMSEPLSFATPKSTRYQPDKVALIKYITNL